MDPELKYLSVTKSHMHDAVHSAEWTQKKLIWVPHSDVGFKQGSVKEEKGDDVTVEVDGIKKKYLKDDLQKMNPPKFEKVEDMAELSFLNEASVLHNLTSRYYSGLIYVSARLLCLPSSQNYHLIFIVVYTMCLAMGVFGRKCF